METITKMVEIKGKKRRLMIGLEISYEDGRFSAMGELKGCGLYMGGQCLDHMKEFFDESGLCCAKLNSVLKYWHRYHLNDCRPGSPRQMEVVRNRKELGQACDYDTMCDVLKALDLYEDKEFLYNGRPYKYGEAWLQEEIPVDVRKSILKVMEMPLEVKAA